jgi:hypothetical protein
MKKAGHRNRMKKRQAASQHNVASTHVLTKHIKPSIPISTKVIAEDLPVTGPGFTALRSEKKGIPVKEYSLEEVLGKFGFRIHEWDGM